MQIGLGLGVRWDTLRTTGQLVGEKRDGNATTVLCITYTMYRWTWEGVVICELAQSKYESGGWEKIGQVVRNRIY